MRVIVDPDLCMGCGVCESIAPDIFELGNELYARVILDPIPDNYIFSIEEAIAECSEVAINLIEE